MLTRQPNSFSYRGQFLHLWDLINYGITSDRQNNSWQQEEKDQAQTQDNLGLERHRSLGAWQSL